MRVVHLSGYGGPYRGSFVPMLEAVAAAAARRGWECELVFPESVREFEWTKELSTRAAVRFLPPRRRAVRELLTGRSGPAILHTHFTVFDVPAALAGGARSDVRVIWHLHSRAVASAVVAARNVVKYAVVGLLVSRILAAGPGIVASARRRGAPARKVLLFPNAIDTGRFMPAGADERRAARGALGLPADAIVLLHFGWDWETKGGDLFLRLVQRLVPHTQRRLVALSVGGGDEARAGAERLGLGETVRVEPPTERVSDLYAAADVLVAASRAEGAPYAVAEALASGIAVVATDIPGHRGLGAAVRLGRDEAQLAEALRTVVERTDEEVAAEAAAGRRFAVERLDLAVWTERLFALYDEVLAVVSPGRAPAA